MDIDFQSALQEKYKRIGEIKEMVLSTCANNMVTSRVVSVACFDDSVYFLSWGHHTKCRQISLNPLVSFCHDNIQMTGRAALKGDPRSEINKEICEKFKLKQPLIFRGFSRLEGMIIAVAEITYIKSWEKLESGFYIDHIDIPNCKAYRLRPQEDDNVMI